MIKKEILLQSLLSLPRVGRKTATEFLKFKSNNFNNINSSIVDDKSDSFYNATKYYMYPSSNP